MLCAQRTTCVIPGKILGRNSSDFPNHMPGQKIKAHSLYDKKKKINKRTVKKGSNNSVTNPLSLRGRRTKGRKGGKLNSSAKRDRWDTPATQAKLISNP